jgi:hypothetical protein
VIQPARLENVPAFAAIYIATFPSRVRLQISDGCVPRTIVGAAEMLRIAATILSHPNEDDVGMGEGPILDIVKCVADGLERIEARRHGLKGFDGPPDLAPAGSRRGKVKKLTLI